MARLKKSLPFIALGVLAVVVPVLATTVFSGGADATTGTASDVNTRLLILVNRMELSEEQMQALHGLLSGLLDRHDALRGSVGEKQQAFEQEMIAFRGTSEDLDALIEAHRTEIVDLVQSTHEDHAAALDELGSLLTYEQGLLLERILPGLAGSLFGDGRAWIGSQAARLGQTPQSRMHVDARTLGPGACAQVPNEENALGQGATFQRRPSAGQGLHLRERAGQPSQESAALSGLGGFRNGVGLPGDRSNAGREVLFPVLEELIHILELKLQA